MLGKGRAVYESAIRATSWGEAAIYALASRPRMASALAARYSFEALLGRPVGTHEASSFVTASLSTLKSGSVVILITGDLPDAPELSSALTRQGAQVLAITAGGTPPDGIAGQTITAPGAEEVSSGGLGFVALVTARLLKRPSRSVERQDRDWTALPRHFERLVSQSADAVSSMAAGWEAASEVVFVGAGSYHAAALKAASLMRRQHSLGHGCDLVSFRSEWLARLNRDAVVEVRPFAKP